MIRFLVKVGLATGAVWYIRDHGVWRESSESVKTYEELKKHACPFMKQAKEVVPFDVPKMPSMGNWSFAGCWNKAVIASCEFISRVPEHCENLADKVLENVEIKKLLSSSPNETSK